MQLYFYKKGQGYYTRLWGSLILWFIAAIGCWFLREKLGVVDNEWISVGVPAVVLALVTWFVYWLQNRPSLADFTILAEGELKKVSWSSRAEIVASTTIVVIVVILMSIFLGLIDILFHEGFNRLGLYS